MAPYEHSPIDPDGYEDSQAEGEDVAAQDSQARLTDPASALDLSNRRDSLSTIGNTLLSSSHDAAVPTISSSRSILNYYSSTNMSLDLAATMASQQKIVYALEDIYLFFISIGAAERADIAFGPHDLTYNQVKLLADSGFSPEAVAFFNMLPFPNVPLSLDWNSPGLRWFNDFDEDDGSLRFIDLRTGHECVNIDEHDLDELKWSEIPLTEYSTDSLGFHWVIDVGTGLLTRRYLWKDKGGEWENPYKGGRADPREETKAQHKTDGDDDLLNWDGDAVQILQEYFACLKNLEMIPIKLWTEKDVRPGFVTQSESVYNDVKLKLLEYGWPDAFRRGEWVRDLPDLVRGWKHDKMKRLEVAGKESLKN